MLPRFQKFQNLIVVCRGSMVDAGTGGKFPAADGDLENAVGPGEEGKRIHCYDIISISTNPMGTSHAFLVVAGRRPVWLWARSPVPERPNKSDPCELDADNIRLRSKRAEASHDLCRPVVCCFPYSLREGARREAHEPMRWLMSEHTMRSK